MSPSQGGYLFNIQRFSIHDGPGIRSTVFFKGCPLHCLWCHNPESIAPEPELVFHPDRCVRCGACVEACVQATYCQGIQSPVPFDHCHGQGICEEVCSVSAWQRWGQWWTQEEVMDVLLRDRLFYEESGGGVTFSGGEPLMQPSFLLGLLARCRDEALTTAVDTSGYAPQKFLMEVAASTDLLLFDLKSINDDLHRQYTGVSNVSILCNLEAVLAEGFPVEIRVPWIPGINDSPEELWAMAEWLRFRECSCITLLPYHPFGTDKAMVFARERPLIKGEAPDARATERMVTLLQSFGLTVSMEG